MKTKQPFVSVIMPVYNGSRFVAKAIESVIKQTYTKLELIICDDGSTDETWSILRQYKKRYPKIVRVYRLTKNMGESAAANTAFVKSRGDYIARLDADDVAHPQRIAKQVDYMQTHPGVIALGTQARVINAYGKTIGYKKAPLVHESIYNAFAYYNPMIHPSVMYRRALLPNRPYIYKNNFESTDDYHAYFELLQHGWFANLPEILTSYRIHGSNKSLLDMKEKFWSDTKLRLHAVSHMKYQAPLLMFPAIVAQATLVTLLPETWLRELFYYLRGIKKINIRIPIPVLAIQEKLKSYATTFLG